jgi:hypothetical protein
MRNLNRSYRSGMLFDNDAEPQTLRLAHGIVPPLPEKPHHGAACPCFYCHGQLARPPSRGSNGFENCGGASPHTVAG